MVAPGHRRLTELAAREQLATWLAEHSATPEACTVESLEGWDTMQVDEWLIFDPPGFADHVFLVADGNVFDFAHRIRSPPADVWWVRPPEGGFATHIPGC